MPPFDYRLLILSKYGRLAASARQRFLQFEPNLTATGIAIDLVPLFDDNYLEKIMRGGPKPLWAATAAYLQRVGLLLRGSRRDATLVHCELFPFLPAITERAAFRLRGPLIFDYDDAIFHQYDQHKNPLVRSMLGGKLQPLLRRADLAICGNAYLQDYAAQYCRSTEIVPTVVDTDVYEPAGEPETDRPVTIGWIGSPSTWTFVKPLIPLLTDLAQSLDLIVRVVGAGPQMDIPPRFEFLPWSEEEEIRLIQGMNIGIMPLPDAPWARGKCGYKLIQYMACGLPVIASPVGVNTNIVDHGSNGFLASGPQEWASAITALAENTTLRRTMGAEGRRKIEHEYSLAVHGPRLAAMVREVMEEGRYRHINNRARA